MNPRVHHQPHRPQRFVIEVAEALIGIVEQAECRAQRLRVERPPFHVRRIAAEAHEGGQRRSLLRKADLEVMSGRSLVQLQRLDADDLRAGRPGRARGLMASRPLTGGKGGRHILDS